MPLGSSSAAPVTSPGPSRFRSGTCSWAASSMARGYCAPLAFALLSPKQGLPAREALRRPKLRAVVVLGHGGRALRQHDPWRPGSGEDVDVRRERVRVVERAHANELECAAAARIVIAHRAAAASAFEGIGHGRMRRTQTG